jgi:pimeloyl-ACP methyl ester carboxylesterase
VKLVRHGERGPAVIVLHGGPGAPGSAGGLARGLADDFRVLEPWQRGSADGGPLTVDQHVTDLLELAAAECPGERPALVGSSWGAMLALAAAAAAPETFAALALVGCGTFDTAARARMEATIAERASEGLETAMQALNDLEPDARLGARAQLLESIYGVDMLPEEGPVAVDALANAETWADMLRLQAEGRYPVAFEAIRAPVIMLHGAEDPHPGPMVRDSLEPHLPQLEYREWQRCGHYPWRERESRDGFFAVLRAWLQLALGQNA